MSVTAIGKWTILPGNKEKVAAAINELCERVKNDPNESGTLIYHPHLVLSNELNNPIPYEGELVFYEMYTDQAALEMHLFGPGGEANPDSPYQDFVKKYADLFLCDTNGQPFMLFESLDLVKNAFVRQAAV